MINKNYRMIKNTYNFKFWDLYNKCVMHTPNFCLQL